MRVRVEAQKGGNFIYCVVMACLIQIWVVIREKMIEKRGSVEIRIKYRGALMVGESDGSMFRGWRELMVKFPWIGRVGNGREKKIFFGCFDGRFEPGTGVDEI